MTVQHPMVIHCSTHCDVPTTLAGDLNNGPLANDVSAPSPPLHQVESHLINKDVLVQHMSCVMLLDQHENASYMKLEIGPNPSQHISANSTLSSLSFVPFSCKAQPSESTDSNHDPSRECTLAVTREPNSQRGPS
ncbi:unnamed protein product [Pleuronectes platessa]|uniref:Uncharacterized protein n=1 Tax=Pleuronectes platessa TaxID=8262 RepID=A0A9N7YQ27_PLEPL|nr:unnamed protein product [Pleuronectes platessa]